MPEYIYLLENRLSSAQQHVLKQVRDAAREAGMTVFLVGGAVRDLTTGSSVRNFNFAVQGNALKLEAALVARGAEVWGTHEPTRTLTLWFPGSVRADVASTRSEEYPKPGKPVYSWNTIVEDLRRRDFTANAMALSLNEGSYGLLLDPLNGVADIEARLLRVASNYGFIEDPSRLIRATRLKKRLGWQLEDRTATRYNNAKESDAIKALSPYLRGAELEKIASEEDALDTVKALEAEGWMEHLFPAWTSARADIAGLESLRKNWIQLLMQGVVADLTAAHFELLTAGMKPDEIAALKKTLVHPGLVRHWEALDESAKEFSKLLTGKSAAQPSATWKLITTHAAEPILWLAHTRKAGAAVDAKFKSFFTVWPEFKKKVPAALMLEMRITPELPGYADLLEQLFYQLIDGNLETDEQMRAFLEPWSPPAPPPPPTVRRSRAKKSESKTKRRISAPDDEEDETSDDEDGDVDEVEEADEDEEEIVEDEVLSTVLEKLHGDEIEDLPENEDADEDGDDDPPVPPPPSGNISDLPGDEGDLEDDLPPASSSPKSKSKPAAASPKAKLVDEKLSLKASAGKGTSGSTSTVTAAKSAMPQPEPAGPLSKISAAAPSAKQVPAAKQAPAAKSLGQPAEKEPAPLSAKPAAHKPSPAKSAPAKAASAAQKPEIAASPAKSHPASSAKKVTSAPAAKPVSKSPQPTEAKSPKKH